MAEQQTPPTAEDAAKLQQVGQAGAQAAADAQATGQTPEEATEAAKGAMRDKRDETGLHMSDADLDKVADMFVGKVITQFDQRGAFDPPPERVQAPAPTAAPAPPGEAQSEQQPAEPAGPPPAPEKRTPAHRFFGVS